MTATAYRSARPPTTATPESRAKLLELGTRGEASAKAKAPCGSCGAHARELVAREDWPDEFDVERCPDCRAVQSYRVLLRAAADGVPALYERRRIERALPAPKEPA